MSNIKLFSAYHLQTPVPESENFVACQVGAASSEKLFLQYHDDMWPDSISVKNSVYSELSMQWQIAKHEQAEYIGMCHYRRLFNPFGISSIIDGTDYLTNSDVNYEYGKQSRPSVNWSEQLWSMLTSQYALESLKDLVETDKTVVTLTAFEKTNKWSLWTLADIGWVPTLTVILFFEYMQSVMTKDEFADFHEIINLSNKHYCNNMIFCKNAAFKQYSEWLFGHLFAFEKLLIAKEASTGRKLIVPRMFGYFSEYMLRPWLIMNHMNIKEVESICFTNLKTDTRI
jgi:hypothetical protein